MTPDETKVLLERLRKAAVIGKYSNSKSATLIADAFLDAHAAIEAITRELAVKDEALREARRFIKGGCYIAERAIQGSLTVQAIDAALTPAESERQQGDE